MTLKPSKPLIAGVAIVIAVAGFLTAGYELHFFGGTNCWSRPSGPPGSAVFTVVMANEGMNIGYNSSKSHLPKPWPVMNVTLNQHVIIHVINNDTQAHGFTIVHYFESGINGVSGLAPGQCYDVQFTANASGSFTVKCSIFCTIHAYMLNGQLNVNP